MLPDQPTTDNRQSTSTSDFAYYNTVDQIYHVEWAAPKLARLELLRRSIRTLWPNGHPTRLIHVAGTGGKGSTCRFLEVGLGTVARAGAFMSPHIFDYRERFSINGEFASREAVTHAWETRVKPFCVQLALDEPLHSHSFLETSILIALTLFEEYEVDWAAMETGVGGRYDQTRALDVEATLLTNVGSDHAHMLGREHWQRALDKAGIARSGIPFLTSAQDAETLEIVADVCAAVEAPLQIVGQAEVDAMNDQLEAWFEPPAPVDSLLSAHYQRWNAALALAAIRELCPEADTRAVLDAFRHAQLLGRFWQVDEHTYADIAHNTEKIAALSAEIEERFADRERILIVGMSGRRVPYEVFPALARVAKAIIVTGASFKGQDPNEVRRQIDAIGLKTPTLVISEPRQALELARSMRHERDVIILTGSTYMIEQVLNPDPYLRTMSANFGWRMDQRTEARGTITLDLPHGPSVVR
jgi:dihydrofolate synthase/folylpolyglutamate synthase